MFVQPATLMERRRLADITARSINHLATNRRRATINFRLPQPSLYNRQPENTFRPFCSERCKLIDLGAWADEQHALPALPETPEEWDALHHD